MDEMCPGCTDGAAEVAPHYASVACVNRLRKALAMKEVDAVGAMLIADEYKSVLEDIAAMPCCRAGDRPGFESDCKACQAGLGLNWIDEKHRTEAKDE